MRTVHKEQYHLFYISILLAAALLYVLTRMRQTPVWSQVPVLVLSALDKAEDIAHAFEAGADDFVTKPFNPDELLARLKTRMAHPRRQSTP